MIFNDYYCVNLPLAFYYYICYNKIVRIGGIFQKHHLQFGFSAKRL